MSSIRARGVVYYPPGPWGLKVPVIGATVEIVDRDLPGRGDDTIWRGTTNANGEFDGQTSDWQDTITIRVLEPLPPPPHWVDRRVPDPSDVRALVAKITKGADSITLPFPYVADDAPPIPLVLLPPITSPPDMVVANVNGVDILINNQGAIYEEIKNLLEAGTPEIKIRVYGPFAKALEPILQSREDLRRWVLEHLGLPINYSILMLNPAAEVIVTASICAAVVIIAIGLGGPPAVGMGFLIGCLGIVLIIAVVKGYDIETEPCSRLDIHSDLIPVGFENCVLVKATKSSQEAETARRLVAKAAFKSHNGKYVVAEGGGGREVKADRDGIGPWETFKIEKTSTGGLSHGDRINIKTSSGQYLVVENGVLKATSNNPEGDAEMFMIERTNGLGQISNENPIVLRSYNNKYVCAEDGGGGEVSVNRDNRGIWETFTIFIL